MSENAPAESPEPTIVVGVDGSPESRAALVWACQEAHLRGSAVTAVAVWNAFPVTTDPMTGLSAWEFPDPEKTTRDTLRTMVKEVGDDFPGVTIHRLVLSGHPAEQLIRLSASASMVVVGAVGHGGFVGMLIGSTSRHVLAHSTCTVVVVR